MVDFRTLLAAQASLPGSLPVDLVPEIQSEIDGRSRNPGIDSRKLPKFSASALKFLSNLSPSLQKAALSALFKRQSSSGSGNKVGNFFNSISSALVSLRKPLRNTPNDPRSTTSYVSSPETTTTTQKIITTTSTTTPQTTTINKSSGGIQAESSNQILFFQKPPLERQSKKQHDYHWGDLQEEREWGSTFGENPYKDNSLSVDRIGKASATLRAESGIVLLIGIFNLLAVVVYAAQRHITNRPSLPPRVLDWQVQKVLDELVLRVHSSKGATQLLTKSIPTSSIPMDFTGRSLIDSENSQQIIEAAKTLLITVGSSPIASSTAKLPGGMYRPLSSLYSTLSKDFQNYIASNITSRTFEGRSMNKEIISPTWLQMALEASKLSSMQWDGVLRTLTIIGQSRSLMSSQSIASALMKAILTPQGTARGFSSYDMQGLAEVAFDKMSKEKEELNTPKVQISDTEARGISNGLREMRRMGFVEDAGGMTGAGGEIGDHWSQRWFSLVTRISPVALDATTLYARAHSSPKCLRSLLCSINFSWKKVGPLQAALTPLLSVLTGWALEDKAPHPLGDSLEAIRAGWLGLDCSSLYPECDIKRSADAMLHQALTYFSKLEISVKENEPLELETTSTARTTFSSFKPQYQQQEIITIRPNTNVYDHHIPRNPPPPVSKLHRNPSENAASYVSDQNVNYSNVHKPSNQQRENVIDPYSKYSQSSPVKKIDYHPVYTQKEEQYDSKSTIPNSYDDSVFDNEPTNKNRENMDPYSRQAQTSQDNSISYHTPSYSDFSTSTERIKSYDSYKDSENDLTSYELYREQAYGLPVPSYGTTKNEMDDYFRSKIYYKNQIDNEIDYEEEQPEQSYPSVYQGGMPSRSLYMSNQMKRERANKAYGAKVIPVMGQGRTKNIDDKQWETEADEKIETGSYDLDYEEKKFEERKGEIESEQEGIDQVKNQMTKENGAVNIILPYEKYDSPPFDGDKDQSLEDSQRIVTEMDLQDSPSSEMMSSSHLAVEVPKQDQQSEPQFLVSSQMYMESPNTEVKSQRPIVEDSNIHYGTRMEDNFIPDRKSDYQFTKFDTDDDRIRNEKHNPSVNNHEKYSSFNTERREQTRLNRNEENGIGTNKKVENRGHIKFETITREQFARVNPNLNERAQRNKKGDVNARGKKIKNNRHQLKINNRERNTRINPDIYETVHPIRNGDANVVQKNEKTRKRKPYVRLNRQRTEQGGQRRRKFEDKEKVQNNQVFKNYENTTFERVEQPKIKNKFINVDTVDTLEKDEYQKKVDNHNKLVAVVGDSINRREEFEKRHEKLNDVEFKRIEQQRVSQKKNNVRLRDRNRNADFLSQKRENIIKKQDNDRFTKNGPITRNTEFQQEKYNKGDEIDALDQKVNENEDDDNMHNYIPIVSRIQKTTNEDKQSSFEREHLQERNQFPLELQQKNPVRKSENISKTIKPMTSYPNDGYEVFKLLQKSNNFDDVDPTESVNSHHLRNTDVKRKNNKSVVMEYTKSPDMNLPELKVPKQRKQFWYHSAYPHLFKVSNSDENKMQTKSNPTSFMKFETPGVRRQNSRRSKLGNTSAPQKIQITLPENTKEMKEHLALRHNKNVDDNSDRIGNQNSEKNTKYKYGLRRGLPAITVENFSEIQEDNEKKGSAHPQLPPYLIYGGKWGVNKDKNNRHSHKFIARLTNRRISEAKVVKEDPLDVVEFGPDDAITDELKNMLLYEYIRDQVKDDKEEE